MYKRSVYNIISSCCAAGIILFIASYLVATLYYPGGSDFDRNGKGFDWVHNYWCELLADNVKSGTPNTAKPIAVGAFVVLAVTMMLCWFQASFLVRAKILKLLIIIPGVVSCLVLFFLSSTAHDLVINIAGAFGLTALSVTLAGLWRQRFMGPMVLGLTCVFLCLLNSFIYYSGTWFYALAVIQKISFVAFLSWFWILSRVMKNKILNN